MENERSIFQLAFFCFILDQIRITNARHWTPAMTWIICICDINILVSQFGIAWLNFGIPTDWKQQRRMDHGITFSQPFFFDSPLYNRFFLRVNEFLLKNCCHLLVSIELWRCRKKAWRFLGTIVLIYQGQGSATCRLIKNPYQEAPPAG